MPGAFTTYYFIRDQELVDNLTELVIRNCEGLMRLNTNVKDLKAPLTRYQFRFQGRWTANFRRWT